MSRISFQQLVFEPHSLCAKRPHHAPERKYINRVKWRAHKTNRALSHWKIKIMIQQGFLISTFAQEKRKFAALTQRALRIKGPMSKISFSYRTASDEAVSAALDPYCQRCRCGKWQLEGGCLFEVYGIHRSNRIYTNVGILINWFTLLWVFWKLLLSGIYCRTGREEVC